MLSIPHGRAALRTLSRIGIPNGIALLLALAIALPAFAHVPRAHELAPARAIEDAPIHLRPITLYDAPTEFHVFTRSEKLASGVRGALAENNVSEINELRPETWQVVDSMHARYYSALQGRFLSVDPSLNMDRAMFHPQAWNRYSYVENNPLGKVDLDGRDIWDILTGASNAYQSASAAVQPVAIGANSAALGASALPDGGQGVAQVAGVLDLTARTLNLATGTGTALGNNGDTYAVGMAFSADLMTASEFTLTTALLAKSAGADTTKVVHFTNEPGAAAIEGSGELRAGSYVTKPSQVRGMNASQVESRLEIGPGKGQRSFEVRVKNDQLRVPNNGAKTSGKAWQRQTTTPCKVGECAKTPQ